MNVELRIERLILDGLSMEPRERPALQAAVEAELSRLLAVGGVSPALRAGGAVASLPGGSISPTGGDAPGVLGTQIARAVYGAIGPAGGVGADGRPSRE